LHLSAPVGANIAGEQGVGQCSFCTEAVRKVVR
jgi:hypothetical protein